MRHATTARLKGSEHLILAGAVGGVVQAHALRFATGGAVAGKREVPGAVAGTGLSAGGIRAGRCGVGVG